MFKIINNFFFFQACAFLLSLVTAILLIRNIGTSEYGFFSFYLVIADFLKTSILLGLEHSVTHFKSRKNNFDLHNIAIFNSKIFVFIILLPFVFFVHDNYVRLSLLIFMLAALIDFSYLHMEKSSLVSLAKATFFSKILYLFVIFSLIYRHLPYQFFFLAFAVNNLILSIFILIFNNQLKSLKFNLISGFYILREAVNVGLSKIFLLTEVFVVIFIFKQYLTHQMFGYFMIIFNFTKVITSFMSIAITPIYKKVTANKDSLFQSLYFLATLGFSFLLLGLFANYILPITFIKSLIKVDVNGDLLKLWLSLGIFYSFVLFMSSVYISVVLIAFKKLKFFYYSRFLYMFMIIILSSISHFKTPTALIIILIVSELTILILALVNRFRKNLSKIEMS